MPNTNVPAVPKSTAIRHTLVKIRTRILMLLVSAVSNKSKQIYNCCFEFTTSPLYMYSHDVILASINLSYPSLY